MGSAFIANLSELGPERPHISIMTVRHLSRNPRKPGETNSNSIENDENPVQKIFFPIRVILQILGRFPFSPVAPKESKERPYNDSLVSIHWLYFGITSSISLIIFVIISIGFANAYMDWNVQVFLNYTDFTDCERVLFEENLVPYVLFWSCLLHSIVGNFSFFKNRKIFVKYLNQWETTVKIFKVKLPMSIRTYLLLANCWFLVFLIMIILFYHFEIMRIAVGGAQLIAVLCLKPFVPDTREFIWFREISAVANLALVYSMYASRALLFLYAYKCRLLRFAFKQWNKRLKDLLSVSHYDTDTDMIQACENLYGSHVILVSTVKQTDKVFGGILQAYYASQILNMCFELFYLARSGTFKSNVEDRCDDTGDHDSDIYAAVLLLVQNVSIFLQVSLDATYVQDEAQKGYEILRSKGVHLCFDCRPKRHMTKMLMNSFSQKVVMTGGKYFAIDRPFVITVLGAVCTYFVIILQFGDRLRIKQ